MENNQIRIVTVGDVIEFTPRYEELPVRAIVVRVNRMRPGMGSITAYRNAGSQCYGFEICTGSYRIVESPDAKTAAANVEQARAEYKTYLSQYPIWAERFAAGQEVSF